MGHVEAFLPNILQVCRYRTHKHTASNGHRIRNHGNPQAKLLCSPIFRANNNIKLHVSRFWGPKGSTYNTYVLQDRLAFIPFLSACGLKIRNGNRMRNVASEWNSEGVVKGIPRVYLRESTVILGGDDCTLMYFGWVSLASHFRL